LTRLLGTSQYCKLGDFAERAAGIELIADTQDYAPAYDRSMAYSTAANAATTSGDTISALRRSEKALRAAEQTGEDVTLSTARTARAWALASAGRQDEAWQVLQLHIDDAKASLLATRFQIASMDWYSTIRRQNDLLALTAMTSPSPEPVLELAMFLRDVGRWEERVDGHAERASLLQARQDVATALLAPDVSRQSLQLAIARRDEQEQAVKGAMVPFKPTTQADLCDALPDNSRYVHFIPQGIGGLDAIYTALVVNPDGCTVTSHPLSNSEHTDRVIAQWRRAASAHIEPPQSVSQSLYELIWHPLKQAIGDADTVYMVPLRGMTHVPFAALSDGSEPLVMRHAFVTLDAPSRLLAPATSTSDTLSGYVVGGLEFSGRENAGSRGSSCIPSSFAPLPGTATEATRVAQTLTAHPRWQSTQPAPQSVDKPAVVDALRSHQVVHLATHGFVADHHCDAPAEDPLARVHAPMATSGIVVTDSEHADSLLTAEELRNVDGITADLVVLSACETGLGMQLDGVGVLGLRKALDDVDSVVLSLWRVPDETTGALMADFYDALVDGVSVQHAMRTAQLRARERGDPVWSWAAWVSHGTWTLPAPE
jgi:CHAT domain-containing protein